MDLNVLSTAVVAAEQRQAFVLCTVVWRRGPTSGQQGSKAIVWPDGRVEGFIGGACAQPTVVSEALAALVDGEPRLLFLGQAEDVDIVSHDGARSIPMACESEGALEMYLEPHLPPPALVAIGGTPAVAAMVSIACTIGWQARSVDGPEVGAPPPDATTAVVVASQGHYDDLALRAALATDAGYIGLVASRKRAHAVIELLRAELGDVVDRIAAPAGLDLGMTGHQEIAVAVIADLVSRRAHGAFVATPDSVSARVEALDPVCGMVVSVADARYRHVHDGIEYLFCAARCQATFIRDRGATRQA